jgi:hypothetical protein
MREILLSSTVRITWTVVLYGNRVTLSRNEVLFQFNLSNESMNGNQAHGAAEFGFGK